MFPNLSHHQRFKQFHAGVTTKCARTSSWDCISICTWGENFGPRGFPNASRHPRVTKGRGRGRGRFTVKAFYSITSHGWAGGAGRTFSQQNLTPQNPQPLSSFYFLAVAITYRKSANEEGKPNPVDRGASSFAKDKPILTCLQQNSLADRLSGKDYSSFNFSVQTA